MSRGEGDIEYYMLKPMSVQLYTGIQYTLI